MSPGRVDAMISLLRVVMIGDEVLWPEKGKKDGDYFDPVYVQRWVSKYYKGWKNRPSRKRPEIPATIPDPLLAVVLVAFRFSTKGRVDEGVKQHRASMVSENWIGASLEEFIANKLQPLGWHCAWGGTANKVDFICPKGRLLQVKNQNTTENSSGKTVRKGTEILKWHRRSSETGREDWDRLRLFVGAGAPRRLAEIDFRKFLLKAVESSLGR